MNRSQLDKIIIGWWTNDMTSDSLVVLNEVTKKYGNRNVLINVSLTIERGDFIVLRGSNGSGKSTLLKIVSGLIPLTSGQRLLKQPHVVIGYAPDRLSKLRMTSTEYLTHMGRISSIPKSLLQERIKELHMFFNLEQNNLKMNLFSKGMLQKLNLMQAMIKTPDMLVLDEPFSGLDKESIQHLLYSLKKIKAGGTSILAAVHDPLLASQFESRTFWIREGRLEEVSVEELSEQPTTYFELACILNKELLEHLVKLFPDVAWRIDDNGLMLFTLKKKDYRDFLLELTHRDEEIIRLQRKEY